jgi:hypothetical protein
MVGTGEMSDTEVDQATLVQVASYHGLDKINAQPYTSELGPFAINCFVAGDVTDYRKIHPETREADVTVAPGTVIVREVLDASGQVAKLTVMAKGPAGYDPSLGDWQFAVTDPGGTPLEENGAALIGRLNQCHDCHLERSHDDFLFGVPGTNL